MTTTVSNPRYPETRASVRIGLWFLRIVIGLLFIFSGLVKANDPLGLANKMNEFFEIWGMHSMMQYSLIFSVLMIGFEIIAGVAVLLGYAFRVFAFLLLLLSLFFTFLTAYVYYWDVIMHSPKVRECGCFGDCIKISNSETFWKDVILTILVLILFLLRKYVRPVFSKYPGTAIMILTAFFAFGIQWYVLEHLPFYDCMPYKKGTNILVSSQPPTGPGYYQDSFVTVMRYKNRATGATQEMTPDEFMKYESIWSDTVNWFMEDRTDKLVRKGNAEASIKDFGLTGYDGTDYTESVLRQPGYSFLLFLKNPDKARTDHMDRLKALFALCQQAGVPTYVLSSGLQGPTEAWKQKWQLPGTEYLQLDLTASKTAMRADPGLMLIKDGVVQGKWSFRDYPVAESVSPQEIKFK